MRQLVHDGQKSSTRLTPPFNVPQIRLDFIVWSEARINETSCEQIASPCENPRDGPAIQRAARSFYKEIHMTRPIFTFFVSVAVAAVGTDRPLPSVLRGPASHAALTPRSEHLWRRRAAKQRRIRLPRLGSHRRSRRDRPALLHEAGRIEATNFQSAGWRRRQGDHRECKQSGFPGNLDRHAACRDKTQRIALHSRPCESPRYSCCLPRSERQQPQRRSQFRWPAGSDYGKVVGGFSALGGGLALYDKKGGLSAD